MNFFIIKREEKEKKVRLDIAKKCCIEVNKLKKKRKKVNILITQNTLKKKIHGINCE